MIDSYKTKALQDPIELDEYCKVITDEGITSYLEVGSKFGGSLWRAAQAMPKGSRVVAVDMPNGTKAWNESHQSLVSCVSELLALGYDARVIWGDSQKKETIKEVMKYGPYDLIMLDADHRLPGVRTDWLNYAGMANRLVAFHDISWHREPEWKGVRIDVPQFWESVKVAYKYKEIVHCPTGKNNGIGVLWTR